MIMLFSLFLLVPLFSPSAGTTLVDVIRSGLKKYNLTHAACLYSEKGACYRNSVVLANYACKSMCPHVVVRYTLEHLFKDIGPTITEGNN